MAELMSTWRRRLPSLRAGIGAILVLGGFLTMLVGGGALLARQQAARSWDHSEEAERAARQVAAPTPRWLDDPPSPPGLRSVPKVSLPDSAARPTGIPRHDARSSVAVVHPEPSANLPSPPPGSETAGADATPSTPATAALPLGEPDPDTEPPGAPGSTGDVDAEPAIATEPQLADETAEEDEVARGLPRADASAVEIMDSEFRFLDPPEPGAQATVAVQAHNRSSLPTGPLRLTLSTRWLTSWRIVDADPPVLDDRTRNGARRTFDFPGLDGDTKGTFALHLVATDDTVDPPELRLARAPVDSSGSLLPNADADTSDEIGQARPETVAPRPRPGPARALAIPRIGLRTAVVPTTWEPPPFVVGQVRDTANLSEGNTVLIGHLTGLAGNVFERLGELEPGDEIVATSRGLEYPFVVSETMVLPGDDSMPIQPTDDPRLTLMTCVGEWDPIGHDYSHRLWVVAEPPEQARATLAGDVPGPLTRQLGLQPTLTLLPPAILGPPPKLLATDPSESEQSVPPSEPRAVIVQPLDGARVDSTVVVRGHRAESADPAEPLWLVVRAEIEGSRWYLYQSPLTVSLDGAWEARLDIGGGPGIRHTIVVAPVDAATDARLHRQVAEQPGESLPILPDAFEEGARIVIERR